MENREFIELVAGPAQKAYAKYLIFPSLTIAQAILESGWGKYVPFNPATGHSSYNLFGIKGKGPAGSVLVSSKEFENGKEVVRTSEFKAYFSYDQSIEDHSLFLLKPTYKKVLVAATPFEAAQALETAGYATDPQYAEKLTRLIQQYQLTQFDTPLSEIPAWKIEIGKRALKEGIITSPEWLSKLDEPMPVWAVLSVALRLLDKTRNVP